MFQFESPCKTVFGEKVILQLPPIIKSLRGNKVLLICDQGIVKTGIAGRIEDLLDANRISYNIFDEVEANPKDVTVQRCAEQYRACVPDVLVAVGGGSSMDFAKAVNILLTNPGTIHNFAGFDLVQQDTLPLVCIPTTSGTASEMTCFSVITDTTYHKRKMSICGKNVSATYALCDPELTYGLPKSLTASTGMDALTHAIEAVLSTLSNPITDVNALYAIRLISKNLRVAFHEPKNKTARSNMMLGSLMAGIAFNIASLGIVHAMAHPMGAYFHVPHGVANAIILPYGLEYNSLVVPQKVLKIGESMGLHKDSLTCEAVVSAIKKMNKDLDIPLFSSLNIPDDALPVLAQAAMNEAALPTNPRTATQKDICDLFLRIKHTA